MPDFKGNIYFLACVVLNLPSLSQVLKEVLRLYPTAPGTVRWTGKEKVIEGVKIPANTTLMVSMWDGLPCLVYLKRIANSVAEFVQVQRVPMS